MMEIPCYKCVHNAGIGCEVLSKRDLRRRRNKCGFFRSKDDDVPDMERWEDYFSAKEKNLDKFILKNGDDLQYIRDFYRSLDDFYDNETVVKSGGRYYVEDYRW